MSTILGIVLAVCIVFNVWLSGYTIKRERGRRKKLQERMDEYDKSLGDVVNEKGRLQMLLNEKTSLEAHLKKLIQKRDKEIERLNQELDILEQKANGSKAELVDSAIKSAEDAKSSIIDLQKTYNELAERYAHPSKKYLINNIIRAYNVKNITELAKALGVSKSAISRMRKSSTVKSA